MWPGLSRSILFSAMTPGRRARRRARATKRSPAPIRSRADRTSRTASTSSNDLSTVRCMCSVSASSGRWKPGQVGEDELIVVTVRDPEDPSPRRLRLVGHDRHLAARERVDERRLADVRPSRDGDEARLQAGRSQVSGSSSAAEYVTSSPVELMNVTSPTRNSYSHWRQPPHGEAVIPIASKSPGL